MELSELLTKLGGRREAEKLCGIGKWASYKWGPRVPPKHWKLLAEQTGLSLEEIARIGADKRKAS